jgi:DNA-binding beta-propeller fold protein YncE
MDNNMNNQENILPEDSNARHGESAKNKVSEEFEDLFEEEIADIHNEIIKNYEVSSEMKPIFFQYMPLEENIMELAQREQQKESLSEIQGESGFSRITPEDITEKDKETFFVREAMEIGSIVKQHYKIVEKLEEKKYQIKYLVSECSKPNSYFILYELFMPEITTEELIDRKNKFRDIAHLFTHAHHQNLADIIETFHENNKEYCVIEKVEGLNIEKLSMMASKPFSEKEIATFGIQLCDALEFLHYRPTPFTLGKIDPDNIIVCNENVIKITEYDFQRFFDPDKTMNFLPDAPSILYGDITSLARVLYFLLSKEHYNELSKENTLPESVSQKMRKLLEITCTEGQKSLGDIKLFKELFLKTQIQDKEEVKKSTEAYSPSLFGSFQKVIDSFKNQNIYIKWIETIGIALIIYLTLIQRVDLSSNTKPISTNSVCIAAGSNLMVVDSSNYEVLTKEEKLYYITSVLSRNIRVLEKNNSSRLLFVADSTGIIHLFDLDKNLKDEVTSITTDKAPSLMITDDQNKNLYVLHQSSRPHISVIDLNTLKLKYVFPAGENPTGLAYLPASSPGEIDGSETPLLIVSNSNSRNIWFINTATGTVTATIDIEGKPGTIILSKNNKKLYVLDTEISKIYVINTIDLTIQKSYNFTVGKQPTEMVMDSENNKLWIIEQKSNKLVDFDLIKEQFGQTKNILSAPYEIFFNDKNNDIWLLNYGTKDVVIYNLKTQKSRRIDTDGKTPKAYGEIK